MDERKVMGALLLAGGVATVGFGIWAYRRGLQKRGLLGNPRDLKGKHSVAIRDAVETDDGYRLTHYRKDNLPIGERVAILQELTAKSIRQAPGMRKLALQITRNCPERDGECEARAIYQWMKKHIRYTGDVGPHALWAGGPVEGVDLFQRADRTVEFGGGDCDDHSILACTLAAHNGLSCKYRVTSPRRGSQEDYTHIYPIIGLPKMRPNKWIAVDTTLPGNKRFKVEAPYAKKLDFVA